jgi:hypothetical protein
MWSKVDPRREVSVELAKLLTNTVLVNARSRRARVVEARLLDQVKRRSNRANSVRVGALIVLLNLIANASGEVIGVFVKWGC